MIHARASRARSFGGVPARGRLYCAISPTKEVFMRSPVLVALIAVLAAATTHASPPANSPMGARPGPGHRLQVQEYSRRLDVNQLNLFVPNNGGIGTDISNGA